MRDAYRDVLTKRTPAEINEDTLFGDNKQTLISVNLTI